MKFDNRGVYAGRLGRDLEFIVFIYLMGSMGLDQGRGCVGGLYRGIDAIIFPWGFRMVRFFPYWRNTLRSLFSFLFRLLLRVKAAEYFNK